MRKELTQVRDGPVKRTLTKVIHGLERGVSALTEHLNALKLSIADSCKQALTAVRERGASALTHISQFLHIRSALEAVSWASDFAMAQCEKSMVHLRELTDTYREAGRHLKNAGRVMVGLEPLMESGGPGRLIRTMESLCEKEKGVYAFIKQRTDRASAALSRLEQAAQRQPSIRDTMRELNKKIDREQAERPAPAVEREGREPDGR